MTQETNAPAGANPKFGRYEILGEIGKGGMGIVYRALDPTIGRTVAIKTVRLSEQGSQDDVQALRMRLLRESQAAGQLSHPNIVPIFDFGEQGDIAYIVMEYISGPTLEQALEQDPAVRSTPVVLGILSDCARALDYAHGKGIVHRDVKPGNIMLQLDGTVKIADFGIAKVMQGATLTVTSMMVGSPYYMAPEQLKGDPVSGRTDQYALATVAYAIFTGRRPFEADSIVTLVTKTLYEEPPPVPSLNPALGLPVDGVLRKALAKDPAARYGSCTEFVEALRMAFNTAPGDSMASRPDGRRTTWVPWAIGAVVLLALVALAAAGVYVYQANLSKKAALKTAPPALRAAPTPVTAPAATPKIPPSPVAVSQPVTASKPAPPSTPAKTERASASPPVLPVPPTLNGQPVPEKEPAAQPEGACRAGLVEIAQDRFQACLDTMASRGFSPAALLAYDNGGSPVFMAAFQTPANRKTTLLTTAAERQAVFNRMTQDGYRPDAVSILHLGGPPRLTEIWVPKGAPFEARLFASRQDFDTVRKAHENDGFMITDLVPSQFGSETRYAVIWVKQPGADSIGELDMTARDLSERNQTLNEQGYRISRISGYRTDSGRRFAAVWQRPSGGAFWEVNMTRENLFNMHAEMLGKGYHLHHISFVNGVFSAVWWK